MLIHRRLTRSEAIQLHEELKTTPNILGYTVAEVMGFRDAFVAEVEGVFAGVCVSKDLLFGWTDIAVLYVLPAHRGTGLGTELYTAAWHRASQRSRHIFTLSRSPHVIHLMKRFGMDISGSMWRAPLAFHLHMNRHMMSPYRVWEGLRKSTQMNSRGRMLSGTRKAPAQHKPDN